MVQKIFIPKTGKYTYPLVVLFEPPVKSSFMQLIDSDGRIFQDGKLENKRSSEITVFLYRPIRILEGENGEPIHQKHLSIGDKVTCKVQFISSDGTKGESEGVVLVEE